MVARSRRGFFKTAGGLLAFAAGLVARRPAAAAGPGADVIEGSVKAWLDDMPGPEPRPVLHVVATARAEVDFKLTLVRATPQGINPLDLLLRLDVEEPPPGAMRSRAIGPKELRYEERPAQARYASVTIIGAAPLTVPVTITE